MDRGATRTSHQRSRVTLPKAHASIFSLRRGRVCRRVF